MLLQLMVHGVVLVTGQSALLNVEEEPRPGPEPAPILPLPTVELIVRDKALRQRIAIPMTVQVFKD